MIKLAKTLIIAGAAIVLLFIISTFLYEIYIINDSYVIIISLICILLYSTGYLLLYLKRNSIDISKITNSIGLQSIIFTSLGVFFKSMHWPYAGIILTISIFLLSFIYAPLNFKGKYENWKLYTRSKRDALLLCLFDLLGIVIAFSAILFKFQHWIGAGVLIIVGAIIVPISIFAWNQKFKKEIIFRKQAEDKLNESLSEVLIQKQLIEEKNKTLHQQNEEIKTQRDQLSAINQSISESILYAKRIQTAVFPKQAYIDEILPENFILFKPRDVVSGDFYWVKQVNQIIVIAAADCTGHGVPGAIMSMMGISFISEIVQKREITQPAQALNELRKQLKQALRQTGKKGESDDGMDIAICAWDTKTKILQYSGANNPLYLIKNGNLAEIKADRMPIGFYPNEKPSFTNHEIQLKEGDVFYLFSDGYMDQFGGEKGMKYKATNFQKILFQNHEKPMQIQKEKLEQELYNWMKGQEQTDDILVMGVRI